MTHAIRQHPGSRPYQCDAAHTHPARRVHTVLDGIGASPLIRDWTARQAAALTHLIGGRGLHPAGAITELQRAITGDPLLPGEDVLPGACAVAAHLDRRGTLHIGWIGDCRAYLLRDGALTQLTTDHNEAAEGSTEPDAADYLTRCLGWRHGGHQAEPAQAVVPRAGGRLLLATDGAYAPLEADDIATLLDTGSPADAANAIITAAITAAGPDADNATALVADL
ncbi:PP2C family protein-serine/threonine phosphatase [Kitasatospora phosalacinea]|uniref:PP2C family protein-serine/threonine phosphatase n=1 Tax=Kitasatospora phosalacinea TaxID=2065 RepID=A0ABW6GRB2_9ACTN